MIKYEEDIVKYEDIINRQAINNYEAKEKKGEVKFVDSNEVIKMIKQNQKNIN